MDSTLVKDSFSSRRCKSILSFLVREISKFVFSPVPKESKIGIKEVREAPFKIETRKDSTIPKVNLYLYLKEYFRSRLYMFIGRV